MRWVETFRSGAEAIRAHRLRSGLTMLGIVIGISSVIVTVGLGLGAQAAVSAPRLHCEGRETLVDARLDEATIEGLRRLGHEVVVRAETFGTSHFARPAAVLVDPATGALRGGVNLFNPAYAIGL